MFRPGLQELLLVSILALLLFGAKRLPDIGRGLGTGIRNFRKGLRDVQDATGDDDPNTEKK